MGLHVTITPGALGGGAAVLGSDGLPGQYPAVCSLNIDFWLDPTAGDDAGNGQELTPWRTFARFAAFLQQFERIDGTVRLWIAATNLVTPVYPNFTAVQVPPLGPEGKVVYIGASSIVVAALVTAAAASSQTAINVGGTITDWTGFAFEALTGLNVGQRRSIKKTTLVVGANVVYPASPWSSAVAPGDTFRVIRPASRFTWTSPFSIPVELRGGGGQIDQFAVLKSGVWFSNVAIRGDAAIGPGAVVNFVGVELMTVDHGPGVQLYGDAQLNAGYCPGAAPWIEQDVAATLWTGWSLQQPTGTTDAFLRVSDDAQLNALGLCGRGIDQRRGYVDLQYGRLREGFSASGGRALIALADLESSGSLAAEACACKASGGALIQFGAGAIALAAAADATLLRATTGATIEVPATATLTGATAGYAQDVSGGGHILWTIQPPLVGTLGDLKSEGNIAAASRLNANPSSWNDGLTFTSFIARLGPAPGAGPAVAIAVLQVVHTESGVTASTLVAIPLDNTIPQNTEGVAFPQLDTTITPVRASSSLLVRVFFPIVSYNGIGQWVGAIFRDAAVDAIAANTTTMEAANRIHDALIEAVVPAGAVTPTTFKVRFGTGAAGIAAYVNMTGAAPGYFGGVLKAIVTVTELAAP